MVDTPLEVIEMYCFCQYKNFSSAEVRGKFTAIVKVSMKSSRKFLAKHCRPK